jgi:molecular chaperone DnaK
VSQESRGEIEDHLRRLKEKISQDASTEEIKKAMEDLGKSSQKLAEEAYKQASAETPPSEGEDSSTDDGDDSGYIDAEYEEK